MENIQEYTAELKERLKERKSCIAAMAEIERDRENISRKKDSYVERLSLIDRDIAEAVEAKEQAVSAFARDQISESVMEKAITKATAMETQRQGIESVVAGLDRELKVCDEKTNQAKQLLKRVEKGITRGIFNIEMLKMIEPLQRVMAAHRVWMRAEGSFSNGLQSVVSTVNDKYLSSIKDETIKGLAEEIKAQYLG